MKTVFKEIIIILLLILAILLILGVFLYDYIPMNKVVPKIEQYETPNNIKEELQEEVEDTENTMTPIVYEINNSDLTIYEKTKDYQKGKVNPFADTNTVTGNTTTNNNNSNSDNNNSNNNSNTNNNNNNNNKDVSSTANSNNNSNTATTNSGSEGSYLPKTGTK